MDLGIGIYLCYDQIYLFNIQLDILNSLFIYLSLYLILKTFIII